MAGPDTASRKEAVIGLACIAYAQNVVCRSCGDGCEAAAIRFSPRQNGAALPFLVIELCTGCGDCVPVCPTGAITLRPVAPAADGQR